MTTRILMAGMKTAVGLLVATTAVVAQQTPELLEDFSDGVARWHTQKLHKRQTRYTVVSEDGNRFLLAQSSGAASALWRDVPAERLDANTISWRWRVASSLTENHRERDRSGDDFAARVFVIFGDDVFTQDTRAIAYVWSGVEPVESTFRNPYVNGVATIVLESGNTNADRWLYENRNFVEDYRRVFGSDPDAIKAVAIVVDTDNTRAQAEAHFDDFTLSRVARKAP